MYAAVILGAFLAGAVPFSWILGKIAGCDLRACGSGNPGAANLYRTAGPAWGISGLALDVVKGALSVLAARVLFPELTAGVVVAAAAAVAGHMWTPFLGFRGGKGVATAAGAFLALSPFTIMIAFGSFIAVVAATRYISLGSMVAALVAFAASIAVPLIAGRPVDPYFVGLCGVAATAIVAAHRKNIKRLLTGTEGKFGTRRRDEP
ncbi:MAG: glycerol-3-phosphate 1-O-acyltransferase PlsY [Candidatus Coatesbacteria bacterium]|nr:MAG: glycerol-3-phosphate 1-O-acyltransferase PlsY [Candidatus Coatesbacteria bacterium]